MQLLCNKKTSLSLSELNLLRTTLNLFCLEKILILIQNLWDLKRVHEIWRLLWLMQGLNLQDVNYFYLGHWIICHWLPSWTAWIVLMNWKHPPFLSVKCIFIFPHYFSVHLQIGQAWWSFSIQYLLHRSGREWRENCCISSQASSKGYNMICLIVRSMLILPAYSIYVWVYKSKCLHVTKYQK